MSVVRRRPPPLIVFAVGRWDHQGTVLISDAVNGGDWKFVEEYARQMPWDDLLAN